MAEAFLSVDILIAYIDAADEADLAVDHRYLSVVAVIHNDTDYRHEFIEHHRLYAVAAQSLIIVCRQVIGAADVVVYNANIHALRHLAPQYLEHRIPHLPGIYYEILKENEFFRLFKLRNELCIHILADGEIFRFCISACSVAAVGLKIFKKSPCTVIVDLLSNRGAHGVVPRGLLKLNIELFADKPCRALISEQNVHKSAEQRQKSDKQHPADLV